MTIESAFIIKGYFVAHRPPKPILDALDAIISELKRSPPNDVAPTPEESRAEELRAEDDPQTPVVKIDGQEDYFACPKTGRTFIKLKLSNLSTILEELKEYTFDQVGLLYNVTSGTLKDFLCANDIDPRQFNKTTGRQGRTYPRGMAVEAGKKRFKGQPCVSCGGTEKFTSSGSCVKCTAARNTEWRDEKKPERPEAPDTPSADPPRATQSVITKRPRPPRNSIPTSALPGIMEDLRKGVSYDAISKVYNTAPDVILSALRFAGYTPPEPTQEIPQDTVAAGRFNFADENLSVSD